MNTFFQLEGRKLCFRSNDAYWRYHGSLLMRLALALQSSEIDTAMVLLGDLDGDLIPHVLD